MRPAWDGIAGWLLVLAAFVVAVVVPSAAWVAAVCATGGVGGGLLVGYAVARQPRRSR